MGKTIFFNIGWMKYYRGIEAEDSLQGGGKFPEENGYGYEIFNFKPFNGRMYGYVQPTGNGDYFERTIRIDKLDATKQDSVDDVLSVWIASNPDKSGTWVIGWYEKSTVYRKYQQPPINSGRTIETLKFDFGYWVTAKAEDCVCLPVEERTLKVPRGVDGGLGQSNVWYATSEDSTIVEFRNKVAELISQYHDSEITKLNSIRQKLDRDFFKSTTLEDARERVLTSIVRRQGQSQFRQKLLTAYKGRCAISNCDVEQALEAAHITPYRGAQTNTTSNGLLLRADLHTLFDLKLITIDPETMKILVAPELMKTQCRAFFQRKITLPESEVDRPDKKAIEEHYAQCKWTK